MNSLRLLCLITLSLSHAFALEMTGVARRVENGEIIYKELHSIELDEKGLTKSIKTQYLKPDGKIFAEIKSDFTKNKLIPQTEFNDFRFKRKEIVTLENSKIKFSRFENDKLLKTKEFSLDSDMVLAQGFNNFIKINFSDLAEKKIKLNFGVLSEMDFIAFKAHQISSNSSEVKFGVYLSNPFLRMFLNELEITYDKTSQNLKRFKGLSNIFTDQDERQNVVIDYEIK